MHGPDRGITLLPTNRVFQSAAATLPERIALARREQLDYASFLEIILSDEVNRRAHRRIEMRLQGAGFQEICRLEDFDWSASITMDRVTIQTGQIRGRLKAWTEK